MAQLNFLNANEYRYYPFREPPTLFSTDSEGDFLENLPLEAIVDFGCWIGPEVEFLPGTHEVYLNRISRSGSQFDFYFRSSAPGLSAFELHFSRTLAEARYTTSFQEVDEQQLFPNPSQQSEASEESQTCPSFPFWSGYLTTGDLTRLAGIIANGETWHTEASWYPLEPCTLILLGQGLMVSLNLANDDRTRSTSPDGCPDISYPFVVGDTHVKARCFSGQVRFRPGYSMVVDMDPVANRLLFSAQPGAGEGLPCNQIRLFPQETPPEGSTLLDGGPSCSELVKVLAGLPGPNVALIGGSGVEVTADPDANTLTVDISFADMAVCAGGGP